MLWIWILSLAIPAYAEESPSMAVEAPAIATTAVSVPLGNPAPIVAASSVTEPDLGSLPATFYFQDGTKLEGRWRIGSLLLDLPQGPLQTPADRLLKIELSTVTTPAPATARPASSPATESRPPKSLLQSFAERAFNAAGLFGGIALRPSTTLGWNGGISFRPDSERWEGRLDVGQYKNRKLSSIGGASAEIHARTAAIRYLRAGGGRLVRLGEIGSAESLFGIVPCTLRFGGGIGLYHLNSLEDHQYLYADPARMSSVFQPQRTWNEFIPHIEAGILARFPRGVELQLSGEFIATRTHVAGYRYGGFSGLLQLAIR